PRRPAQFVMGKAEFRVDFGGLAVTSDGLIEAVLALKGHAQVNVRLDVIRGELEGPAVTGDGLVQPAHAIQRVTEVIVAGVVIRVKFGGFAKASDGLRVILPVIAKEGAQTVVTLGKLWIEFNDLAVALDCLILLIFGT